MASLLQVSGAADSAQVVSACEPHAIVGAIERVDNTRMKILVVLALFAGSAHADGGYVLGEIGGTSIRGATRGPGNSAVRLRGGLGITIGDWSIEAWGAGDVSDFFNYDGCVPACAAVTVPIAGLTTFGVDVRRNFTLVEGHRPVRLTKFFKPRLQLFLHGGAREAHGEDGITGYAGPGLGVGGGIEINVRIFAGYVELGTDRFAMTAPGSTPLDVQTFHIVLGERIGFAL